MTDLFNEVYACKNEQAKNNVIATITAILDERLNDDEKNSLKVNYTKGYCGQSF